MTNIEWQMQSSTFYCYLSAYAEMSASYNQIKCGTRTSEGSGLARVGGVDRVDRVRQTWIANDR